ncbi:MAG: hypothetical protein Q9219_003571 [cf. Caloplaca sp. 3 TL-2023]
MSNSNIPSGSLQILLDPPPYQGESYVPGDVVKGKIVLRNPGPAVGIEASLSFTGISKVQFKEKGRLFSPAQNHEDDLLSWRQNNLARIKQRDRLIWPFSFPIPKNVHSSLTRASSHFSDDEKFARYPGYTLPPSFGAPPKGEYKRNGEKETAERHITIAYILKATLVKPHPTHPYSGPTCAQREIRLSPQPLLDSQVPAFHVDSSLHRISPPGLLNYAPNHDDVHGYKSHLKPYIHLHVSMPGTIVTGQALDLNVSFDHSFMQSMAAKLPPVILQSLNVTVNLETHARASTGMRRQPQAKWEERLLSCGLDKSRVPSKERSCILSESLSHRWDVDTLLPELKNQTLDIPTFKTWNIALSYTLHVRGEVVLDKERIRFDVKKPLIVLPDHSIKEQVSLNEPTITEGDALQSEEAAPPPPYSRREESEATLPERVEETRPPSYQAALSVR